MRVRTLLVVISVGLLAICVARALYVADEVKQVRSNTVRKLSQIFVGLQNYNSAFGKLPPTVSNYNQAMHSWRLVITPYAENLYGGAEGPKTMLDLRLAWNHPSNQRACYGVDLFCNECGNAQFMTFSVPGSAFSGNASLDELDSSTILVVEVHQNTVHWMEPGDLSPSTIEESSSHGAVSLGNPRYEEIFVLFADGAIWALKPSTPVTLLIQLATGQPQEKDRHRLLGKYLVAMH